MTGKTKYILVWFSRGVASRWREEFHSLSSSLVRPLLDGCIQLWAFQHERDIDILEQVQQRPQRLSGALCLWGVSLVTLLKLCFGLYQYFCADKSLASRPAILVYEKVQFCVLKQLVLLKIISVPSEPHLCKRSFVQLQRLYIKGMAGFEGELLHLQYKRKWQHLM